MNTDIDMILIAKAKAAIDAAKVATTAAQVAIDAAQAASDDILSTAEIASDSAWEMYDVARAVNALLKKRGKI